MSEIVEMTTRAAPARGPALDYENSVTVEIERATGQKVPGVCAQCPLGHWEISFENPPPLNTPLQPPSMGTGRWIAECYCRVRHAFTARLEPNPQAPATLQRAPNTRLVFRCSDHGPAVEDWRRRQGG